MELFNVELPEIRAAYCDFMKHRGSTIVIVNETPNRA
jgi:hypothetical protein